MDALPPLGSSKGKQAMSSSADGPGADACTLTAEELADREAKRQRRLLANREAGRRCRLKKSAYVLDLEKTMESLQEAVGLKRTELDLLQKRAASLRIENYSIRAQINYVVQDNVFRDVQQEALTNERDSLKQLLDFQLQQQQAMVDGARVSLGRNSDSVDPDQ